MTEPDDMDVSAPVHPRSRAPWLVVAAALVIVAGVAATLVLGGDDEMGERGDETGESIGGPTIDDVAGSSEATDCVELYDLGTLTNREYAFDGTVRSVEGPDMTFEINEWFRADTVDGDADTITLDHQGNAGMLFAPEGPALEPGTRVLVAGDGGFVWSCGFTQLHDPALADQWREALG